MRRRLARLVVAVALLVIGSAALADQPATHLYGPEPAWAEYRRIAEETLRRDLYDPESARFSWVTGIYKGWYKPFLSTRVAGYIACGAVNAKNRLGGYTGAEAFIVVIDYGRVLYTESDGNPRGGVTSGGCSSLMKKGLLPPPPPGDAAGAGTNAGSTAPPAAPAAPLANIDTGLALRAMPEGAYVAGVVPGSPAATAGLKPGMVIASVNAIPLTGMGEPMLRLVDAAGGHATLTLVGGATIKLGGSK